MAPGVSSRRSRSAFRGAITLMPRSAPIEVASPTRKVELTSARETSPDRARSPVARLTAAKPAGERSPDHRLRVDAVSPLSVSPVVSPLSELSRLRVCKDQPSEGSSRKQNVTRQEPTESSQSSRAIPKRRPGAADGRSTGSEDRRLLLRPVGDEKQSSPRRSGDDEKRLRRPVGDEKRSSSQRSRSHDKRSLPGRSGGDPDDKRARARSSPRQSGGEEKRARSPQRRPGSDEKRSPPRRAGGDEKRNPPRRSGSDEKRRRSGGNEKRSSPRRPGGDEKRSPLRRSGSDGKRGSPRRQGSREKRSPVRRSGATNKSHRERPSRSQRDRKPSLSRQSSPEDKRSRSPASDRVVSSSRSRSRSRASTGKRQSRDSGAKKSRSSAAQKRVVESASPQVRRQVLRCEWKDPEEDWSRELRAWSPERRQEQKKRRDIAAELIKVKEERKEWNAASEAKKWMKRMHENKRLPEKRMIPVGQEEQHDQSKPRDLQSRNRSESGDMPQDCALPVQPREESPTEMCGVADAVDDGACAGSREESPTEMCDVGEPFFDANRANAGSDDDVPDADVYKALCQEDVAVTDVGESGSEQSAWRRRSPSPFFRHSPSAEKDAGLSGSEETCLENEEQDRDEQVEPPKLAQPKAEPPKLAQPKVEPPKLAQPKVEPPKLAQPIEEPCATADDLAALLLSRAAQALKENEEFLRSISSPVPVKVKSQSSPVTRSSSSFAQPIEPFETSRLKQSPGQHSAAPVSSPSRPARERVAKLFGVDVQGANPTEIVKQLRDRGFTPAEVAEKLNLLKALRSRKGRTRSRTGGAPQAESQGNRRQAIKDTLPAPDDVDDMCLSEVEEFLGEVEKSASASARAGATPSSGVDRRNNPPKEVADMLNELATFAKRFDAGDYWVDDAWDLVSLKEDVQQQREERWKHQETLWRDQPPNSSPPPKAVSKNSSPPPRAVSKAASKAASGTKPREEAPDIAKDLPVELRQAMSLAMSSTGRILSTVEDLSLRSPAPKADASDFKSPEYPILARQKPLKLACTRSQASDMTLGRKLWQLFG